MKAINRKRLIVKIATIILAATAFIWLHKHGMSPVVAALAVVFLRSIFRFLFKAACCLMTLAVLIGIIVFLLS